MISPEDVSRVTDDVQFRRYIGRLVQAEKRLIGAGGAAEILTKDNTADDGVDGWAKLEMDAVTLSSPLFPHPDVYYQLKLDATPETLRSSLRTAGAHTRIGQHLKNGGHYVVVIGAPLTLPQEDSRRQAVLEGLGLSADFLGQVHVISAAGLCAATRPHLDVYVELGLPDLGEAETLNEWRKRATRTYHTAFECDPETAAASTAIQSAIAGHAPLFHLMGPSGSGKSRTAYEALASQTNPPVLYFATPSQLLDSELLAWLKRQPNRAAIVVVDGCNGAAVKELNARAALGDSRIIAIGETAQAILGVPRYNWKGPTENALERMVGKNCPKLGEQERKWVVKVCGRNPLMALQLGAKLQDTPPQERHKLLSMGEEDRAAQLLPESTGELAMHIAIFDRIGYRGEVANEFDELSKYLGMNVHDARATVEEKLRDRELIQGKKYITLRPLILRLQLLRRFLRLNGPTSKDLAQAISKLRDALPTVPVDDRIMGGIALAIATSDQPQLADAIVGAEGLFASLEDLEQRAATFRLQSLAEGAPAEVLEMLERVIGSADAETLGMFKQGRRAVVPTLATVATVAELFPRAARLLAKLALNENESWSNNASGAFAELFSPAIGHMAPTNAPGSDRIKLLENMADDPSNWPLIARALSMLFSTHHVRYVSSDPTSRNNLPGWTPKTWGEVFDFIADGWKLAERLAPAGPEIAKVARAHVRELYGYPALRQTLAKWLHRKVTDEEDAAALEAVADILAFDKDDLKDDAKPLEEIIEKVMASGLRGNLQRYVVIAPIHDEVRDRHPERIDDILDRIARDAVREADPQAIVDFLVAKNAARGHRLAFHVGKHDHDVKWWPAFSRDDGYAVPYLIGRRQADEASFSSLIGKVPESTAAAEALAVSLQGGEDVERLLAAIEKHPEFAAHMRIWPTKLDSATRSKLIELLTGMPQVAPRRLGLETALLYGTERDKLQLTPDAAIAALQCAPSESTDVSGREVSLHTWVKLATALVREHPDAVEGILNLVEKQKRPRNLYGDEELARLVQACASVDLDATRSRVRAWLKKRSMVGIIGALLEPDRRGQTPRPLDEEWIGSALADLPGPQVVSILNFIHLILPGKEASAAEIEASPVAQLYARFKDVPGIDSAIFNSLSRGGFGDPAEADRNMAEVYLAMASKIPSHPFATWLKRDAGARERMAAWWDEKREDEGWL